MIRARESVSILARVVTFAIIGSLVGGSFALAAVRDTPARLVAIGDVHGEFDGLVDILREAGLIDQANRWIGGDTVLVQTGDVVDRGPDVRRVMDLLITLQSEAAAAGGEVIVLLGNHESLNLIGDFQDASADILASFAGPDAERLREEAWREWVDWLDWVARSRGGQAPAVDDDTKAQWMVEHPPGYFEYMRQLGPEGDYGKWILSLPVMARVGDTIFMHAGIGPEWSEMSMQEINDLHQREFSTFLDNRAKLAEKGIIPWYFNVFEISKALTFQIQNPPLPRYRKGNQLKLITQAAEDLNRLEKVLLQDSPLWYRGYTNLNEPELLAHLDRLEEKYGVHRFVVAHSPMALGSIVDRIGGRVFLIDTGMLASYYKGRPSALEIAEGRYSAIYTEGERQVLLEPPTDLLPASAAASDAAANFGWNPQPAVWRRGYRGGFRLAAYGPQEGGGGADLPQRVWRDPLHNPLPFKTIAEMEEFLATATVVSQENIPKGVTKPKKILLEKGGVTANAKFNYVDRSGQREKMADGTVEMYFLDSYKSDLAAYKLSLLLGLESVPPAVARNIDGQDGIVQLWVEGLNTYENWLKEDGNTGTPASTYFDRQLKDMYTFDLLIRNTDRNQGNIAWDDDNNLWLIDHTRSLARDPKLREPDKFKGCSRQLYQAIQALSEGEVEGALSPYLGKFEIKALMKRRDELVKLIDKEIKKKGEGEVLFNYEDPPPGMVISYD